MSERHVVVIGGGGHAKVVIATLQASGRIVDAIVDDNPAKRNQRIFGIPVVGPIRSATNLADTDAIIAIGDNRIRRKLAQSLNLRWTIAVHPSAVVHHTVRLSVGTVVFAGSVVQPDSSIGAHAIINTKASIDHDCELGDFVHVAPGTQLGGGVSVGEGTFLGIGSAVLPNLRIGDWSILGGGSVAIRDIAAGSVVAGTPAAPIRAERANGRSSCRLETLR